MPVLQNSRHEAFAQGLSSGMSSYAAYKAAGYRPDRHHAARLATNGHILARVAAIRAENDRLSQIDRAKALAVLAAIVRTPIGEVGRDHPLCQEYAENEHGYRIKMPGKIEALRLLGQWCGWETGTQAEQKSAQSLAAIVAQIVKKKVSDACE